MHTNAYDYVVPKGRAAAVQRYYEETVRSTVFETRHPAVRVHPETRERTLLLEHFIKRFVHLSATDSARIFSVLQGTLPGWTMRYAGWSTGDVAMWDNRATQHILVDDYGDQPRILRRVTVAGEVPVNIHGQRSAILKRTPSIPEEEAAVSVQ